MTEREMEDLLSRFTERLLEEALKPIARQQTYLVGRSDLVFQRANGNRLIVEVKRGSAPRGVGGQLRDYWGAEKARNPGKAIDLMVVANEIPFERKRLLEDWNIEWREIPEKTFRDVANAEGYIFKSEQEQDGIAPEGQELNMPQDSFFLTKLSSKQELLAAVAATGQEEGEVANVLIQRCERFLPKQSLGYGVLYLGSAQPRGVAYPFGISTSANVLITLRWVKKYRPFDSEHKSRELLERVEQIVGGRFLNKPFQGCPWFPIMAFRSAASTEQFVDVMKWAVDEINSNAGA
jgi:hypothetical protein